MCSYICTATACIVYILYRVGVALDAYLIPVEDRIEDKVEQPLLFINSWTFQWPENITKIKRYISNDVQTESKQ